MVTVQNKKSPIADKNTNTPGAGALRSNKSRRNNISDFFLSQAPCRLNRLFWHSARLIPNDVLVLLGSKNNWADGVGFNVSNYLDTFRGGIRNVQPCKKSEPQYRKLLLLNSTILGQNVTVGCEINFAGYDCTTRKLLLRTN